MAIVGWSNTSRLQWANTITAHRVTTDFCFSFWGYRSSNITTTAYIFSKAVPNLANRWAFVVYLTANKVLLQVSPNGTGSGPYSISAGDVLNQWSHVLCGRDHATGKLRMYLNGSAAEETNAASPAFDATASPLTIGGRENNTNPAIIRLFDARIFNIPPTQALANALYGACGRDGITDGLVLRTCIADGCVGFGSLEGKMVYDHSPERNHITVTGAPVSIVDPFSPFPTGDE